jgi:hypothetical protein
VVVMPLIVTSNPGTRQASKASDMPGLGDGHRGRASAEPHPSAADEPAEVGGGDAGRHLRLGGYRLVPGVAHGCLERSGALGLGPSSPR